MSAADWTTQFRGEGAMDTDMQSDGPGRPSGDAASQAASADSTFVGSRVGAYLVTRWLGAGGVGEVFKAVDVMLKREVAIKVLRPELACDPLFLERFRREAQLHAKLSHPNVASVHAFVHEGDKQIMVMEYVPGVSLDEFLRSGGPVPVQRALGIFRRVLDGIEHAHGCGIVHRDIKPANIMLADNGQVKVMDFGIARALDCQESLTRHGQVTGTAKSMSPEQIRGAKADVRSDIYSLGIVLYTLLAGRAPFDGQNDHALMMAQVEQAPPPLGPLVDDLPPKLEAIVMRALEKDPGARFQAVREFSRAIDACIAQFAAAAPPARDPPDARTASRTAVNPALQGAQRLPDAGSGPDQERDPGTPRRRDQPWLGVGAVTLAVLALAAGTIVAWPRLSALVAPAAAPPAPIAVAPVNPPAPAPAPAPAPPAAVAPTPAVPAPEPVPAAEPPRQDLPAARPPGLTIARLPANGIGSPEPGAAHRFKPGERIRLRLTPGQDAHVYCYLQDETRRIVRFFPNRFNASALVKADSPLDIPGAMPFELVANSLKATETIACFASTRDLTGALPASVVGDDFAALSVATLDEVRQAFAREAADRWVEASFRIEFR